MDKAGKALRRGGVKLKNMNSGHGDLHMVISDLTEVRSLYKSLISAQTQFWEDLIKWAGKERSLVVQESVVHFSQLHALWAEVQREFVLSLKKFKHQFELILEGEQHVDKSRAHLKSCEQREAKIRKEMRQGKGGAEGVRALEQRLDESKQLIKAAQSEVSSKVDDLEAMKMVMLKDGLDGLSDYYIELSDKAAIVFEGHKRVSAGLPDVSDKQMHNLKYANNEQAKKIVLNTRESILCYRKASTKATASAPNSPPPYSSDPAPIGFAPFGYPSPSTSYSLPPATLQGLPSPPQYTEQPDHRYDLPPRDVYENIDGPFGDMSLEETRNNPAPPGSGWRL